MSISGAKTRVKVMKSTGKFTAFNLPLVYLSDTRD